MLSFLNTNSFQIDYKTNFYKEKFKKEQLKQKENIEKNIEKLKNKNEIFLIFSQHYIELKNEYLTISNLSNLLKKENIVFFNSPEDEIYKHFRFNKLSIFGIEQKEENNIVFNLISKILFNLRNLAYSNFLIQNQEKLVYYIELNDNNINEKLSFTKLKKKGK